MSKEIRSFDYVNHPYPKVKEALTADAKSVFRSATRAAASRSKSVAAALEVDIAGIKVAKDVDISVKDVREDTTGARATPRTLLGIEWTAASSPGLFPLMKATLAIYPLTGTETQIDFSGEYQPPMGWLGSAVDAVVGHKIAEASVHRFVSQVAEFLRSTLA